MVILLASILVFCFPISKNLAGDRVAVAASAEGKTVRFSKQKPVARLEARSTLHHDDTPKA